MDQRGAPVNDFQIRVIARLITICILLSAMLGLVYYSLDRVSDPKAVLSLILVGCLAVLIVQTAMYIATEKEVRS